jgi:O-antigen/teichoic acid export membrane protein
MDRYFDTDHLKASLKTRALRGGAVTIATQAASFALTMASIAILARLLTPDDYGLMAMVTVVVGFMAMFNDFGLSMATIQRREITQPQVSTLFWLNTALGLFLMLLTAAFAPVLAWFYDDRRLVSLTVFLAVTFLISGLGVQHQALLRRQMRYFSLASIEIIGLVMGIVLAVVAALRGLQYWALAIQMVATATVSTAGFWLLCRWRPGPPSRRADIASMLAFGGNLAAFNVLNYLARNFDQVLIGRVWGGSELGSYERASRLLQMPIKLISTPISHVAIPVLCHLQNDPKRYREYYLKALHTLAFVIMPGMAFITVMASDLVGVLMGDQWARAGVIFSVLGVLGLLFPVSNTLGWHYIASGTTNRMLRWGLFDGVVVVIAIAIGVSRGALGVAVAFTAARVLLFLPGIWYATRMVPVEVSDILRTIRIPLLSSIAMGASLYFVERVFLEALPVWHRLLIAFPSAAIAYLAIACLATWSLSPLFDLPRLAVAVFKARDAADSDPGSPG